MKNLVFLEKFNAQIKSLFDQIKYVNKRTEDVWSEYDRVNEYIEEYEVISKEKDGKVNQNININTTFGSGDISDPKIKDFDFTLGSLLHYWRVLEITNKDRYEVINFQSLMNILFGNGIDSGGALGQFLKKTGDTATGSYLLKKSGINQKWRWDDIPVEFADKVKILLPPVDPTDGVNKAYVDTAVASSGGGSGSTVTILGTNQPIFTSGKIAIGQNDTFRRTKAPYVAGLIPLSGTSAWRIKLLKLNSKATWDGSDKSWKELFGTTAPISIPGHELSNANDRIPFPVDYSLYLEFTVPSGETASYALFINNGSSRVRTPILGSTASGHSAEFTAFVDSDGDLSLIIETSGLYDVPWSSGAANMDCIYTAQNPLLYFTCRQWSYYPKDGKYVDGLTSTGGGIGTSSNPQILSTDIVWNKTSAEQTAGTNVTRRYRLLYSDMTTPVTWSYLSLPVGIVSMTFSSDSIGYYVDIVMPPAAAGYSVTFKAEWNDGTVHSLNKLINFVLATYVYADIVITNVDFTKIRYDLLPEPFPISFTPTATGGEGVITWSVVAGADTTLTGATYNSTLNKIEGTYTGTEPVTVMLSAHDITTATAVTKKIIITVDEQNSGGGSGSSGGNYCFTNNMYVLTSNNIGKHFKDLTIGESHLAVDLDSHTIGQYKFVESFVEGIHAHKSSLQLIVIDDLEVTPNHMWATSDGLWRECGKLTNEFFTVKLNESKEICFKQFSHSVPYEKEVDDVFNIQTKANNYFVGPTENGPWTLVHNMALEQS